MYVYLVFITHYCLIIADRHASVDSCFYITVYQLQNV